MTATRPDDYSPGKTLLNRVDYIAQGFDPANFCWCPVCDYALIWHHNGLWCTHCHQKVSGCCEGAKQ